MDLLVLRSSPTRIVRAGYSRDHKPDRPQVTIGLSMDKASGMPMGLTVNAGNILDVSHFEDTFEQMRPLLPKDAMAVFDNGAYSGKNSALLDEAGIGFVTRQQLNASDDRFVKEHPDGWIQIDEDISYQMIDGNLGRGDTCSDRTSAESSSWIHTAGRLRETTRRWR